MSDQLLREEITLLRTEVAGLHAKLDLLLTLLGDKTSDEDQFALVRRKEELVRESLTEFARRRDEREG